MPFKLIITTLLLAVILPSLAEVADNTVEGENACKDFKSCYSCLSQGPCVWCVNKAKCTKDTCGNDNIIYPGHVRALMAGSQFCPRVVLPEKKLILRGGTTESTSIVVKITQIYMYMVFTPWKCKINLDGKEVVTNGMLLSDQVYCQPVVLNSSGAYTNGSVSVLWEYTKAFDGSLPFTVCRCDLDPSCVVCTEQ